MSYAMVPIVSIVRVLVLTSPVCHTGEVWLLQI
jgi:hypothetical protein